MWFSSPCGTKLFTVNLDLWACQFMCQALYVSVWCSWYGSLLSQVLWSLQNTLTSISPSEPQGSSADKPRRYNHKPPSTGIGSPPLPECLRESGMVDLGPWIPTPLLFLPCQCHFTLSRFSLPRHIRETFFPCFSGRHGLFLPTQQLFFSLGSYPFSIFAGTDVTVIERWAQSPPAWARTSLATQHILIWWHTYGN